MDATIKDLDADLVLVVVDMFGCMGNAVRDREAALVLVTGAWFGCIGNAVRDRKAALVLVTGDDNGMGVVHFGGGGCFKAAVCKCHSVACTCW